jgi:hypothetical protein
LTNADGSAEYRVLDARSRKAVFIDATTHADAKADKLSAEFPNDSWFEIYDYGVGDEVIWPYPVSVTLDGPGQYRVVAPVPVRVELPEGSTVGQDLSGKVPRAPGQVLAYPKIQA